MQLNISLSIHYNNQLTIISEMQWSKAAFFGFIECSHDISSTKIDIPMNEQTSKSIVCHCRSAPVFQTSHSRKIPFTGHGPYRHCEQNPKTSMQIRIIVRVCKFNCFFQRLIESCFWSPAQNIFHFTISAINPIESGKSSSYLVCISSTCSGFKKNFYYVRTRLFAG